MSINKSYVWIVVLVLVVAVIFVAGDSKDENKVENMPEEIVSEEELSVDAEVLAEPETDPVVSVESDQVKEFIVDGKDFSFIPNTIKVKKGDEVRVVFKSTQGFHDFIIEGYGVATKQLKSPGEEVIEFTADKSGTFEYYCSVGSHRQMGMVGTFVVEE